MTEKSSWADVDVQLDFMPQAPNPEPKSSPRQRETREFHPLSTPVDNMPRFVPQKIWSPDWVPFEIVLLNDVPMPEKSSRSKPASAATMVCDSAILHRSLRDLAQRILVWNIAPR